MISKFLLLVSMMLTIFTTTAQQPKTSVLYKYVTEKRQSMQSIEAIALFKRSGQLPPATLQNTLTSQQLLILDRKTSRELFQKKPLGVSLMIPYKDSSFTLELIKEDISMGGLNAGKLTGRGNREKTNLAAALHYRGYIKNKLVSIASLSVFENGELMCLFSDYTANYNLGKINGGNYILFNAADMIEKPGYGCGTDETPAGDMAPTTKSNQEIINTPLGVATICNKVRIYWEVNYKLYNLRFANNYTNTINYLSGLFNQVAVMFLNEGIVAELSEMNVWTTPDTFTTTSSATGLAAIRNKWNTLANSFNGDLCMLIDGGTLNNGGRAYLLTNTICNRYAAYGYSNVRGTFNNVPVYSWDVEVVTHETGHQLGSRHTHWCGWNTGDGGTCGAIDDCTTPETTSACSSCSATTVTNPGAPSGFTGTVMSYCHLRSGIGINLANGFGPLPGSVIRNNVSISPCTVKDNKWTGATDTAWENTANWSCGSIPTAATDVTIPGGLSNYPVVNSAAVCRKLIQAPNAGVTVRTGFTLNVAGRN